MAIRPINIEVDHNQLEFHFRDEQVLLGQSALLVVRQNTAIALIVEPRLMKKSGVDGGMYDTVTFAGAQLQSRLQTTTVRARFVDGSPLGEVNGLIEITQDGRHVASVTARLATQTGADGGQYPAIVFDYVVTPVAS